MTKSFLGVVFATALMSLVALGQEQQGDTISPGTSNATSAPEVAAFPVQYSSNGRYLVDQSGTPFPIMGRTAWFVTSLSVADYHIFVDDTAARGYNAIEFHVVNHDSRGHTPPFNANGDRPFLNRLNGTSWNGSLSYGNINSEAPDFTTPNEAYWSVVDGLLSYCESKGILVFMFPAYVGYVGGSQGWMQEIVANGTTKMQTYGTWIATRYRNQRNLVWMMGGDMGTPPNTFNGTQTAVENALLTGLKSVTGQQSVLFSAEWDSGSIATDQTSFGTQMTLNGAYSHNGDVNTQGRRAYAHSPIEPSFLVEGPYDQEGPDGNGDNSAAIQPIRRFQWWSWLSTTGGYIVGNGYVIWFQAPAWQNHLDTQCTRDLTRLNAFMGSIAWYNLVPSGLSGMRTLVTAGNSVVDSSSYVTAAAAPDGTIMVAYIPPAHSGPITVDMGAMSGPSQARWFDPTSAAYTNIGTALPNSGTRVFTPPGNNSVGQGDWVLRIDRGTGASTPTPSPTSTATATVPPPTPSPTSTATATATVPPPTPSPTSTATATATVPRPTPSPSPSPTSTATATATVPQPTPSPTLTATATATATVPPPTSTPIATPTPVTGLVAAYNFNEGSGTTVTDFSGHGITGTVNGAAWTTGGRYGNALSFNGSSSYVDLGDPAPLETTGSMTWSAWVKAAGSPPDDGEIVSKSDSSSGWQSKTSPDTGPHTFGAAVSGGVNSRAQRYSTTVRSLNVWYHVAGVYDATARTLDIYVNGVRDNGTLSGTVPASQINSAVNVNIGRRSGGFYFNGIIDDVRIYDRALSQGEIQADMSTPIVAPTPTVTPSPAPTATATVPPPTPTSTPTAINMSGAISYCSNPVAGPVPDVTLNLTGDITTSTLSDSSGDYQFSSLNPGGSYTVTPAKSALTPGSAGISTLDVVAIQRHFLDIAPLPSGCQLTAADVNGDTLISVVDIISVQRFILNMPGTANVGKHQFAPASRTYSGVVSDQTGQNYDTLIIGDVATGFAYGPEGPSQSTTSDNMGASEVPAAVATLSLPNIAVDSLVTNFIAQVTTSAIDARNKLVGFQGDFTFDERLTTFQSPPVSNAGVTAGNWNVSGNVLPGAGPIRTLRISAYSNDFTPLSGSGTLFQLRMTRVSEVAQGTQLIWAGPSDQFIFIDADLNTHEPDNVAQGNVTPVTERQ